MTTLQEKYLAGLTSPAEERQLREMLQAKDSLKGEEQALWLMLSGTVTAEAWEEMHPSVEDTWQSMEKEALYDQLLLRQRGRMARLHRRWMAVAASLLLAVGVGLTLTHYISAGEIGASDTIPVADGITGEHGAGLHTADDETVAYVYGQRVTDDGAVLQLMAGTMDEVLRSSQRTCEEDLYNLFNR